MTKKSEPIWDTGTGVSGLLLNRQNKRYYSRIQVNGKRSFLSLKTKVWSTAKLRHADSVAKSERIRIRRRKETGGDVTVGVLIDQLLDIYESPSFSKSTKVGIRNSISILVEQWNVMFGSNLRDLKPSKLTTEVIRKFADFLATKAIQKVRNNGAKSKRNGYGAVVVNKVIGALRRAMRIGTEKELIHELPFEVKPVSGPPILKAVVSRPVHLPSIDKMHALFDSMRDIGASMPAQKEGHDELRRYLEKRARQSADLIEFMAYSGSRISEANTWKWEYDLGECILVNGTKSKKSRNRMVPKIPAMVGLLNRIRAQWGSEGRNCAGKLFTIKQCSEGLTTACVKVGISRLTHHSLRHYFATVCIESGVDIPTLSRWLGHSDGGALAMRTYGHLRMEHSLQAAKRVNA